MWLSERTAKTARGTDQIRVRVSAARPKSAGALQCFLDHAGATIGGRLHVTLGVDVRVYSFCFWGERYRTWLSLTSDGADHYGNGGVSIGLWH